MLLNIALHGMETVVGVRYRASGSVRVDSPVAIRYADDCNMYVRSEQAGQRVMASLARFINGRLRLKINQDKSAVARPEDRHFLGFSLRLDPPSGSVETLFSERTQRNAMNGLGQLTPRNWGDSLQAAIERINRWLTATDRSPG